MAPEKNYPLLFECFAAMRAANPRCRFVLAAGADAFLRGGGAGVRALFLAGEDVLELDHAGIGEHQGGVVARHQRAGFHDGVTVAGEIVEEGGADVVRRGHWGGRGQG